jgi:hypothetical protein
MPAAHCPLGHDRPSHTAPHRAAGLEPGGEFPKGRMEVCRATGTKANWCVLGVYFLNETPWASIAGISTLRADGPIPCRDFNSDLETVAKSSSL